MLAGALAAETAAETTASLHPLAACERNCESGWSKRSCSSVDDVACDRAEELCLLLTIQFTRSYDEYIMAWRSTWTSASRKRLLVLSIEAEPRWPLLASDVVVQVMV